MKSINCCCRRSVNVLQSWRITHKLYVHTGPQLLCSLLNHMFWIVSGRRLIREHIFRCHTCYKLMSNPVLPFIGNLPLCKCRQALPFSGVGVDFLPPFAIKEGSRKSGNTHKAYLYLFECMATWAIHSEVTSTLSKDTFLARFERFIVRRGLPSDV